MGIVGSIVTFLIIWWTVLFAVLPMRVKGVWEDEAGTHVEGVEPGAPNNPQLWFKIKRTTWITTIIWVIVFIIVSSGVINFDR